MMWQWLMWQGAGMSVLVTGAYAVVAVTVAGAARQPRQGGGTGTGTTAAKDYKVYSNLYRYISIGLYNIFKQTEFFDALLV